MTADTPPAMAANMTGMFLFTIRSGWKWMDYEQATSVGVFIDTIETGV
jgi:hypothetical protein